MKSMRNQPLLLATLLIAACVAAQSSQTCYWPNGGQASSNEVARSSVFRLVTEVADLTARFHAVLALPSAARTDQLAFRMDCVSILLAVTYVLIHRAVTSLSLMGRQVYRGGCTDKSWGTSSCPTYCNSSEYPIV